MELREALTQITEIRLQLARTEVFRGYRAMPVAFSGTPMRIPVGEGWLGRACNGRGEPIDGGPSVLGGELRSVAGAPINPARRAAPSEALLTGEAVVFLPRVAQDHCERHLVASTELL